MVIRPYCLVHRFPYWLAHCFAWFTALPGSLLCLVHCLPAPQEIDPEYEEQVETFIELWKALQPLAPRNRATCRLPYPVGCPIDNVGCPVIAGLVGAHYAVKGLSIPLPDISRPFTPDTLPLSPPAKALGCSGQSCGESVGLHSARLNSCSKPPAYLPQRR